MPTSPAVSPAPRRRGRPPAASSYHHGDLRNALIAEGRTLLEEMGPRDLSLRETARRAGVSEAAYSKHFESKEAFLAAIAESGWQELAAQRRVIIAREADLMERTRQLLLAYVRFAQRHRGLFFLMVGPTIINREQHQKLYDATNASFDLFASTVVEFATQNGWKPESLDLLTYTAWVVEHGLAMLIVGDRVPRKEIPVDLDEMISFSIGMLFSAVLAGPAALKATFAKFPRDSSRAPAPKRK